MTTAVARIAKAIDYLIEHRSAQPSLEDAASHVGMSAFHFQRVFKQYAGVTPKQFLAAVTLQSAKAHLESDRSVLDVAHDVGLSGAGRLHDHFVTIDAISPGEYKAGGSGLHVTYGFAETPFGRIRVATTPRGIAMLDFVDDDRPLDPAQTPLHAATFHRDDAVAEAIVRAAFSDSEPLRINVHGTNFQLRVWNALLALERGERVSYGQLAAALGNAGASRAVGNAVAANPVALLIPCHRVIAASGVVGNYKWGSARKRALLAWESARDRIR